MQPFTTPRIVSKGRYTLSPGEPPSPCLALLSSSCPTPGLPTSPSVADAPPSYVPQIRRIISAAWAPSRLCSRRLSWHARRRTRGCGRHVSVLVSRGIGGAWSGEPVVACCSQGCSSSTSRTLTVVPRSPRRSASAPSTVRAHPGDHRFHLVHLKERPGPLKRRVISTPSSLSALIALPK